MSSSKSDRGELFALMIERPSEDVAIEICDAFDQTVAAPRPVLSNSGAQIQDTSSGQHVKVQLPRGLYVVRSSLGSASEEQVVRISGETTIAAPLPARASSAAYQGVESSHEYYSYPAAEFSQKPTTDVLAKGKVASGSLFLFVRARDKDVYAHSGGGLESTASLLHLELPDGTAMPVAKHSQFHADGWLAFSATASAGDYLLHDLGGEPRTTPVALYPDWQTQLFLTFDRHVLHNTLHVSLARPNRGFLPDDDWARAVDLGLSVLVGGRGALPAEARRILLGDKFENPMLGLIAAWIALQDPSAKRSLVETVIDNLNWLLPDSPDVAVLRIAVARRYQQPIPLTPIRRTPMMRIAASELIAAVADHPEILPAESRVDDISSRLYADSAFTSWRPIDSDLPASLQALSDVPRVKLPNDWFMLKYALPESKRSISVERELADVPSTEPPPLVASDDPGSWLSDAVADVIEQQARRQCRAAQAAPLDLRALAKQTGVTPKAARQVLESAPLEGIRVAMSLSDRPAAPHSADAAVDPIHDVLAFLARSLIAAGASIAYGGDFRKGGFTELLATVIKAYNETGTRPPQSLHCFIAAHLDPKSPWPDLPLVMHHLLHSPDVAGDAVMPPPLPAASKTEPHLAALYFSDMRRVMAKHSFGRIIAGGQTEPRTQEHGPGYGGRYPGVVEEAWCTLQAGQPLYVAGGFGGAAALVADLLESKTTPAQLTDTTFAGSPYFQANAAAIDADPYRETLGLPRRMEDLADAVRQLGLPQLASDEQSTKWNGLTVEENHTLFRTRDPQEVTSLALRGLQAVSSRR